MAQNNAVTKAFKILEVISEYPDGINLANIVKETGLPKSTVHDICKALYQTDAIYFKDRVSKLYVIGSKMYVMGQVYTQNSNFILASEPLLKAYADKFDLTVSIAKRLHNTSVNVYKYESKNTRVITPNTGDQVRLIDNVVGKVFLAFLDEERKTQALQNFGVVDDKELNSDLIKITKDGYAIDNNVSSQYIYSIAVPVFNFENKNIGVLSATSIKGDSDIECQIKELQLIGNKVSKILGYKK